MKRKEYKILDILEGVYLKIWIIDASDFKRMKLYTEYLNSQQQMNRYEVVNEDEV